MPKISIPTSYKISRISFIGIKQLMPFRDRDAVSCENHTKACVGKTERSSVFKQSKCIHQIHLKILTGRSTVS